MPFIFIVVIIIIIIIAINNKEKKGTNNSSQGINKYSPRNSEDFEDLEKKPTEYKAEPIKKEEPLNTKSEFDYDNYDYSFSRKSVLDEVYEDKQDSIKSDDALKEDSKEENHTLYSSNDALYKENEKIFEEKKELFKEEPVVENTLESFMKQDFSDDDVYSFIDKLKKVPNVKTNYFLDPVIDEKPDTLPMDVWVKYKQKVKTRY